MTPLLVVLLLANAAFNVLVWPTFYRRVTKDPRSRDAHGKPTRFLTVHVILFAVSMVLAAASALAAVAALVG